VERIGTPSRAWLGVPVRTPSGTIGVLVVQHYENEHAYAEPDLNLLSSIGGSIALAIEYKRAEQTLREQQHEKHRHAAELLRFQIHQMPRIINDHSLRPTSMAPA
jgi:GAF domain-containing protein